MNEFMNVFKWKRIKIRFILRLSLKHFYIGIIRFLIERNPSARLWNRKDYKDIENLSTIYIISRHQIHYLLMPWIAKHFPWVLDHPDCQERPPSIYFVDKLCQWLEITISRRRWWCQCRTQRSARLIRQFLNIILKFWNKRTKQWWMVCLYIKCYLVTMNVV